MRALAMLLVLWTSIVDRAAFVVPSRLLHLEVESGRCVDEPASVSASRDGVGYRFDVVVPATPTGLVSVQARITRGVLRLWITRSGDAVCMRRVVIRPRAVHEVVSELVVETREGVVVRERVSLGTYSRH